MTFPGELHGSVWHMTNLERYKMITKDGEILANPNLPDNERWSTSRGEEYYPFVRSLGGVSVFDFRDPHAIKETSGWATFVPCRHEWPEAVWIEIDISLLGENFLSGQNVRDKWKAMKSHRKFIAQVEGAVLNSVPTSAFVKVLIYSKKSGLFAELA